MRIRAAAAAWRIQPLRSDARFFGHMHDLVSEAHDEGAQLLVLPELFSMELLGLEPSLDDAKAPRYLAQYAQALEDWLSRIAQNSGLVIIGGSHFREKDGEIVNACPIALPDGTLLFQEKNNLTEYERLNWNLARGDGIQALPDPLGVLVCYDSEFPEATRKLCENGTQVLAVPSWTETQRGFQRVRWGALSRAVENQIFVIHATLVGDLGGEPVPSTYGSSAIIAPSVEPFPVEAILRETPLGQEGVIVADLDLDMLDRARANGEVRNWHDRASSRWELTPAPQAPPLFDEEEHLAPETELQQDT